MTAIDSMNTAYDLYSRVSQTTYPSGFAGKNVYTDQGDLLEVREAANDTLFWTASEHDALDREIRTETEGFDGRTIRKDTVYDNRGRGIRGINGVRLD